MKGLRGGAKQRIVLHHACVSLGEQLCLWLIRRKVEEVSHIYYPLSIKESGPPKHSPSSLQLRCMSRVPTRAPPDPYSDRKSVV